MCQQGTFDIIGVNRAAFEDEMLLLLFHNHNIATGLSTQTQSRVHSQLSLRACHVSDTKDPSSSLLFTLASKTNNLHSLQTYRFELSLFLPLLFLRAMIEHWYVGHF